MGAPVDVGAELLTHLRGQGFASAAELLSLAVDTAHADYRRAVCRTVAGEVLRAAEREFRHAATFARAKRPRLTRDARRGAWTFQHLASLVTAYERDDRASAARALADMAACRG